MDVSLITRFLLLAFTDHLVIFCCGTSLPLVSITRFLLLATSSVNFFIHARGLIYFTLLYSWSWPASFLLLLNCYAHARQEGVYRPSMVYMDYIYFNITISGSLRVDQSLQTASVGYRTYAREAIVFSIGIFGWISYYCAARDSNGFNAQSLF
jgi:hypothetical protein